MNTRESRSRLQKLQEPFERELEEPIDEAIAAMGKAERVKLAGLERKCGGTLEALKKE
jgi:hypothetical protein